MANNLWKELVKLGVVKNIHQATNWCINGRIKVNGDTNKNAGFKVNDGDVLSVDGEEYYI